MYDTKYFERHPLVCGNRVTFIGRRIEPEFIQKCLANPEWTRELIKEDYNLTDDQIDAALAYVHDPECLKITNISVDYMYPDVYTSCLDNKEK